MSWRNTAAVLALMVALCMTGCKKPPATPGTPWGPESTWTFAAYPCSVVTTAGGNVRYVMNWTDLTDTGEVSFASGETAEVDHTWSTAGTYDVKAQAILDADPSKASGFSPAKSVKVVLDSAPDLDSVVVPPVAVVNALTYIAVGAHDPEYDSLRVLVSWGGGSKDTATSYSLSPGFFQIGHVFSQTGTATIIVRGQDWKGARSKPDTVHIPVGTSGGVKWFWWSNNTDQAPMSSSVIVANDGTDEVALGCCDQLFEFFSVHVKNGNTKKNMSTRDIGNSAFSGDPGLNGSNHIIVGDDEGVLYALTLSGLDTAWAWSESAVGHAAPEWGAPAFSGTDIYVGRDDSSLYHFTDNGASVTMSGKYSFKANVVDAPVVDRSGNVLVGTDSGYLTKFDKGLSSPIWSTHVIPSGEVNGVIIGSDRTIYCGSDSPYVYAIDPDSGHVKWAVRLNDQGNRPVLGKSALFVGTDEGTFYSIDPSTGAVNWHDSLSPGIGFETAPIVAANDYIYAQNADDVLYALKQSDGTQIWACNCENYLPQQRAARHGPKPAGLTSNKPNPSITSTGDIIVVGGLALYCVAGYTNGPLDAAAPWPKWQKNLNNTGSASGK